METVSFALKTWLSDEKITQQQIADKFGVSQSYIQQLISGKSCFGKKAAKEWADAFGFSYSFLLTGEGSLFDENNKIIEKAKDEAEQGLDPETAGYWKAKYEDAEKEIARLNGTIEGLQMALKAFSNTSEKSEISNVG